MVVEVEVAAERGHPFEAPAHAPLEGFDLRERRAGDHDECHVALRQVDNGAVEMVGEIRAAGAAFLPARAKHEMVDDELALAIEELGERLLAVRRVENVRSCPP